MLLLRSIAHLAHSAAVEIAQAARFESRAIELPLEQLGVRGEMFERRIAELKAASVEAGDLLERGTGRALAQVVNEPLESYARREDARLRAELRQHLDELGKQSTRELSAELEAWIDTTIRAEFAEAVPRFEGAIADQLTELEQRYARAHRANPRAGPGSGRGRIRYSRRRCLTRDRASRAVAFSFKLKDVEHALDMLVGFGRTITPGALGRRLVMRDAEQRLIEMADRHAGRLRSELAGRVAEAVREYRRDLTGVVDEAVGAIRAAIERATADRRRGEQHTRARLDELAWIERRCAQLAAELERWIETGLPADDRVRPVRVKARAVILIDGRLIVAEQLRGGRSEFSLPGGRVNRNESVSTPSSER